MYSVNCVTEYYGCDGGLVSRYCEEHWYEHEEEAREYFDLHCKVVEEVHNPESKCSESVMLYRYENDGARNELESWEKVFDGCD